MNDESHDAGEDLDEVIDRARLAHPSYGHDYTSWSVEGISGLARDANRLADKVTFLQLLLEAERIGSDVNLAVHELRWQRRAEEQAARRESEVGALMDQVAELRRALAPGTGGAG